MSVEQPPLGESFAPPIVVHGNQPSVLRWIEFDAGTYVVEASYTSLDAATMTVKVWSADGSFHVTAGDHLATLTVGAKTRVEIPTAGRYLIAITAETGSSWEVRISAAL